ncbi:MAG: D-alanyl-D-alanine carboxypeptidase, partial [Firmicutes bacterium]|nr:D-alanyl-D-alanine carboxypeptidase [Bacillota bacterium]
MNYSRRSTKICHLLVWVMSFFIWWVLFNPLAVAAVPDLPAVVGEAAIVIDAETGNVLGSKNPDLKLPIASTTKIMTALLALENGHLADRVTLSEEAALQEGSSMYTSPGESYTLEELLYGLMLNSGNDAAWALAEHIAGSVPDFVAQMNTRAQELGAVNTHFTNPSGLPDPDHYSTAHDLALIAKAAMAREDFRRIAATKAQNVPWPVKETDKLLVNHNKLLWRYEGADGIKTGYTNQARQCLVASATRDGQRLIAVVLKSEGENVWSDAQRLLDWGFTNFSTTLLVHSGDQFGTIPVKRGEIDKIVATADRDLKATLPKESVDLVQAVVQELPASLTAPVDKGQILGKVVFT